MHPRVRPDAPLPSLAKRHRIDGDTDPDLSRFAGLSEEEKLRVIIRVLCGLVALEEIEARSEPQPVAPPVEPAPRRRRLLPFLGYEKPLPEPALSPATTAVVDLDAPLPPLTTPRPRVDA